MTATPAFELSDWATASAMLTRMGLDSARTTMLPAPQRCPNRSAPSAPTPWPRAWQQDQAEQQDQADQAQAQEQAPPPDTPVARSQAPHQASNRNNNSSRVPDRHTPR